MKVSELTSAIIADYLRVDATEEASTITMLKAAAVSYVKGYTGLTDIELDTHEDITIAVLILCAEMFDNRQMTVQNDKENPTVKQILAMYAKNYL